MDREKQVALRARLRRLHALPPEALINAVRELAEDFPELAEDLQMDDVELLLALEEAQVLDDDPTNSSELGPFVGAPIKPRPHLNSGAIALPEPDEPDR